MNHTSSHHTVCRHAHQAMGTTFEILSTGSEEGYAGQAAQAVFREVDRLDNLFSRFNPSSEISQINRLRPGESLRIGLETYECLTAAEFIRAETAGAFDINFRSRIKLQTGAGTGPAEFDLISEGDGFRIRVKEVKPGELSSGLDLDLGGIGKGYALDRAVSVLSDWTIERVLVHAGTSTAVAIGDAPGLGPEEAGWPVGVGGAWESAGAPKRVLLKGRALSGSGTEVKGRHILDPRTGLPPVGHLAAWSSHPSAALADGLSTAFMVMGAEEVRGICERHPEVWALLILREGICRIFNREIFHNTL